MPDGTTAQADATLSQGESETPQTISWEEHQKALRDATSAIKADIGREKDHREHGEPVPPYLAPYGLERAFLPRRGGEVDDRGDQKVYDEVC